MDEVIYRFKDGFWYVLQPNWLRITQNPVAPKYPKTGDTITLKGHDMLSDGEYIVQMVTEFEPPFHQDEDGRDIRIKFIGVSGEWNGKEIRNVIVRKEGEE